MRPLQYQPFLNKVSNATAKSSPIDMRQIFNFSLQALAGTGSCAGTFQVQVCNTPCLSPFVNYNPPDSQWSNLGTALTFAQASTASNQLITKTDSCYVAMRIVFTDTSSGTNTALITVSIEALGM
jgi:hypothetical protein